MPLDICVDVSDAQGSEIDWPAVRAAGVRIAFIKATEGATFVAKTWERNRSEATKAGISVVPYHFLRATAPASQVVHFRDVAGLEKNMAFALDWEGAASTTCTAAICEEIGEELALTAERKPIGYWGRIGATPAPPTAKMLTWDEWVPRYPVPGIVAWSALPEKIRDAVAQYWSRHPDGHAPLFAQYTSWGRLAGISGNVDRSVAMFDDVDAAIAWIANAPESPSVLGAPAGSGPQGKAEPAQSGLQQGNPTLQSPAGDIIAAVKVLQSLLTDANAKPGPIDGILGPRTVAAYNSWRGHPHG